MRRRKEEYEVREVCVAFGRWTPCWRPVRLLDFILHALWAHKYITNAKELLAYTFPRSSLLDSLDRSDIQGEVCMGWVDGKVEGEGSLWCLRSKLGQQVSSTYVGKVEGNIGENDFQ